VSVPVGIFIAVVALSALIGFAATGAESRASLGESAPLVIAVLALTLTLQLLSVDVGGKGTVGVSAIGVIVAAIALGAAAAMSIAVVAAVTQWARRRGPLHRAVFDASNFALAAGASAAVYHAATTAGSSLLERLAAATAAGAAYALVNNGLLCIAMGLDERRRLAAIWRERFHWALPILLAFGPAAGAVVALAHGGASTAVGGALLVSLLLVAALRKLGRFRPLEGSVGGRSA
jgi:hypothetical protein